MKRILLFVSLLLLTLTVVGCDEITSVINQKDEIVFTLDELAVYDGQNGQKGYTAVNGVVYDVTDEFPNGEHQGFKVAGIDATQIFLSSPHTMEMLGSLEIVGILEVSTTQVTTSEETQSVTNETLPVFTLEALALFNGQNGQKGYIAVDGVIYDVTNVFPNGIHQGVHLAGTDATQAFDSSPHARSILTGLMIVGSLEGSQTIPVTTGVTQNEEYMPVFTLDELAVFDGKNGQKVYVAVLGVIYDGTDEFYQGMHQGFQLGGIDATSIFQSSPHAMSILSELPIVGSLDGFPLISIQEANNHYNEDDDNDDYDDDDYDNDDYKDDDDDYDDNDYDDDDYDYDGDASYISPSELPVAILDYLSTNYPNIAIDEAELEDGIYEVELVNGLELEFDINGNFLSVEMDD